MAIDRERVLAAAQKYVERKRYDRAITEYERIIQEDPSDARTLLKIGDLYSKMDNYAEAVATYERVGRYYSSHGFSLKAIAVYKQIRDIVGRHAGELGDRDAHIVPKLADLYQQLGLTSDAIGALEEVAARCQQSGRDAEAVDIFKRIVAFDTTNPIPHVAWPKDSHASKTSTERWRSSALRPGSSSGRDVATTRSKSSSACSTTSRTQPMRASRRICTSLGTVRMTDFKLLRSCKYAFSPIRAIWRRSAFSPGHLTQIGQAGKAIEVQKELARLARETGKLDLFEEVIARLRRLVPNDEEVLKLAGIEGTPGIATPARPTSSVPPAVVASIPPAVVQSVPPSVEARRNADVVDFDAQALDSVASNAVLAPERGDAHGCGRRGDCGSPGRPGAGAARSRSDRQRPIGSGIVSSREAFSKGRGRPSDGYPCVRPFARTSRGVAGGAARGWTHRRQSPRSLGLPHS